MIGLSYKIYIPCSYLAPDGRVGALLERVVPPEEYALVSVLALTRGSLGLTNIAGIEGQTFSVADVICHLNRGPEDADVSIITEEAVFDMDYAKLYAWAAENGWELETEDDE